MIKFTKVTSNHGPLTKTMSLTEDGRIEKMASAQLYDGIYETVAIERLSEFSQHLEAATSSDAFCYGTTEEQGGRLVRESDLAQNPGAIARTSEYFGWSPGPGILMLDNDDGQVFDDTFAEFLPEYVSFMDGIDMLVRPSSSSNIYNAETGQCLRGMVNQRAYAVVSDSRLASAVGKLIEDMLWETGHGYFAISSAGTVLKRCPVDTSVWQPERLDFVGGAVCQPPLVQRYMSCRFIEGGQAMLDVRTLPRISRAREDNIRKIEQRARDAVEPDRVRVRAAWVEQRVSDLIDRGVNPDEARQSVEQAADRQTLGGAFVIKLEDGTDVGVAELLADPDKYHGQRCHDPLEPDYHGDPRVAIISLNNGGRPYIFSHAHGGGRYVLKRPPRTIQILSGESARCTDDICKYLSEQGELYERGQVVLDVNQDGQTRVLSTAGIKYLAGSACNLVRFDSRSKEMKPTDLTDTVAQLIVGRGGKGTFRKLAGVITAPTMTPSGRLVSTPGYDTETGLLLLTNGEVSLHQVVKRPSAAELKAAFDDLWHAIKDFPFDGDVSRSCMLGALLTAVVRPCLPTAPAFGFDAPTQGSGKTKLAQCVAALATGRVESLFPPPTEEEETRKKITSALAKSRSVLIFDNMETQLKSSVLAAFLTSHTWSDRLLGGNTEIEADNRMLVLITGNNLAPVGDIVRRMLTVRIDPKVEACEVWKREFAIDPLDYIVRNRQRLVAAALTLLSGYIAAGRPKVASGRLASFEEWDDLVRQPVVWLGQQGISGLCDPTARLTEAAAEDPDTLRLACLAQQWFKKYGSVPQPLNEVTGCQAVYASLKEVATDRRGDISAKMLAAYLRQRVGKIVDGYRFEKRKGRANTSLWLVVGPDAGDGGFGGFDGSVLAHPAIHIKK